MLSLIPHPRRISWGKGRIDAKALRWRMGQIAAGDMAISTRLGEMQVAPRLDRTVPGWTLMGGEIAEEMEPPKWPGGYVLDVKRNGVIVRGVDASGLFFGLVTLQQMLTQADRLPEVRIQDWPAVAVRYHHDDISRKQVSKVEDFRQIIRQLAMWKISHYTPYMEDVLHLKSFPDIGEGRGKLTPDEVRQIVEEGRRNNVEVFPTYSLIGHQENLLKLPKYARLGRKVFQPASSFDVRSPELRAFLRKVIADVCELFPSKLFHMGFDETQGLEADEFINHANWCATELVRHGKTPLMWVDMICNHFGYAKIRKLHPAIIPVNWQYDASKVIPHQRGLRRQGRPVWGLAGYNTWCAFLPDQHAGRANYTVWTKAMTNGAPWSADGLGSSQWGDDGYENSRQLPQNAFAAFAEAAWSGEAADAPTFDRRFDAIFYGKADPIVRPLVHRFPASLSMSPGELWRLHRAHPEELCRRVAAGVLKPRAAMRDLVRVENAGRALGHARVARNPWHLDQYRSGLMRMRSVLQRIAWAGGMVSAARVISGLGDARDEYRRAWLKHNKPENLKVSLAVFDEAIAMWSRRSSTGDRRRFVPLSLEPRYDTLELAAGGVPIGPDVINGVPWLFAGADKTHLALKPGRSLRLRLANLCVKDIHLIASGPRTGDGRPQPALSVRLMRKGQEVFSEDLLRVRHLCDWWAPFGNHIWAGGGYAHIDPRRVRPAVRAAEYYALMEVSGFGLVGSPVADAIELKVIDDMPVQVFAITIEKAVR